MVLWLSEELGPLAPPQLVAEPDVGDANSEEAGHLTRVHRGRSVKVGLSSVGPPPTFTISQLLASWLMVGSPLRTSVPPRDAHRELCRAVDIGDG
jgi:hypothetical protein